MGNTFKINDRQIGFGNPTFIVAEIAQGHDGSLGTAHAYIDALSLTGVDAVKFQTHMAQYESTHDEPFRVKFSLQDETRYDYWKRMEFTREQWQGLAEHALSEGLVFLSSAFSIEAFGLLNEIGVPAWKVGSGEFRSRQLIEAMCQTGKPILFSTGMSSWSEIDSAVSVLDSFDSNYALLQCTSAYPTKLEEIGLNVIGEFRQRYGCAAGLSDHSGSIYPGLAAIARGADILEVHVVFDKREFGPDVKASITLDEIDMLVKARDSFSTMDDNPVDKDEISKRLLGVRDFFTKSIAPTHDLKAGTKITESMITAKKPGTGIPVEEIYKIIGKKLIRDVSANHLLRWEDIEDE